MFLYGGNSSISDMPQVVGTLRSCLLRNSRAYRQGKFTMDLYDSILGDNMRQHFVENSQEQEYLNDVNDY